MGIENTTDSFKFKRNDRILRRKFYQYLLPSVLSVAATSLNEFFDSIVVAQTLGSDAMSKVNMSFPIMLVFSTVYVLLGVGGSTVYAAQKGDMERDKAASTFSIAMISSLCISLLLLLAGLIFINPISTILSSGISVTSEFSDYIRILLISAPFIILLQTLLMFFPAEGMPKLTTIINIIANVVNIIFDFIYIEVFHMKLAGAAYATLTGYIIGLLVIIILWMQGKYRIEFGRIGGTPFSYLGEMAGKGVASAVGQLGFFIKISFSNYMAVLLAGTVGITIFSACLQTVSVISIFIGGILNAMIPIVAALYGQKDYNGIRLLMNNILKMEVILSAVLFIIFELFPSTILQVYDIKGAEELTIGIPALRIFSFMFLFRQTILMFIYFLQTIGRKSYATALGIVDGFLGIVLLTLLFYKPLGVYGLILSYPVCSFLMLLGIVIVNYIISKKSNEQINGFFLLPKIDFFEGIDFSQETHLKDISIYTKKLEEYLRECGIDEKKANLVAVAYEEICAFTSKKENMQSEIDVLIRIKEANIYIFIRSIGPAFAPTALSEGERYSNIDVLNRLAKEVRYDYVLGMNQTQIVM